MPKVKQSLMTGNWGEHYVAENLAHAGCLVRHVPQGRDIGIDLYCESIMEERPFLHCWVQVKTGESFTKLIGDKGIPVSAFKEGDLGYWLKQVVPVVIAVVSDPATQPETAHLFCPMFGDDSHFLILRKVQDRAGYKAFIEEDLPHITYLWGIKDGVLRPFPVPRPGYVRSFPVSQTYVHEEAIRRTLHMTLWRLSEDILSRNLDLETLRPKTDALLIGADLLNKLRPYIGTLETFIDLAGVGNYQNHVTVGVLHELDGRYLDAEKRYRVALSSVTGDVLFMAAAGTDGIVTKLKRYLSRVKGKIVDTQQAPPRVQGSTEENR